MLLLVRQGTPPGKQLLLFRRKRMRLIAFREGLCQGNSEGLANRFQCRQRRSIIPVEHICNGGMRKVRFLCQSIWVDNRCLKKDIIRLPFRHCGMNVVILLIDLYVLISPLKIDTPIAVASSTDTSILRLARVVSPFQMYFTHARHTPAKRIFHCFSATNG